MVCVVLGAMFSISRCQDGLWYGPVVPVPQLHECKNPFSSSLVRRRAARYILGERLLCHGH